MLSHSVLSDSLTSVLLPLPVFPLPHLCLGRLPAAGTSDTGSSFSRGSLAPPAEGPAEPTQAGPPDTPQPLSPPCQPSPTASDSREGASRTAAGALLPGSRASSRHTREGLASRVTLLGSANPHPPGAQLQKMGPAVPGPRTSRVLRVRMDVGLQLWSVF